ncbi:adhesion G protein-coupled receptor F5 [Pangasianodon hypophthalmus]|uniref:adhesion G protein-coupled receptor F5 n=1 Tax=Pangasianodon hypophthalmus TaxID=310915 RepID=UPI002307E5D9|nr:adhesion G protein-coupled receptor F5 [Pangasianodon hypophthalmus]
MPNITTPNITPANTTMPNITTPNITPANTTTDTHAISFSLKINEEFDLALTNSYSIKYKNYTKRIGDSINHSYSSVSGYKANSATVTGFRSGSVIADFNINATSDNLNLISANQQVVASLREQGFNISDDAFSRTVKDGLYESTDQIYPENDVTLTCNTTVNDNITWTKDGKELAASDKYLINKTALVVKNTAPSDSGVYECRTRVNSMPYVIWQSLMIPDPNIQVNSSKVLTCGNLKERLQCCVHTSYSVKWVSNEVCGEPVEQNIYGCIYCDYDINANECQPSDQNLTVTCTLTKSNYFRSIRIDAVNRAFTCSDDKSNGAFGAGSVGENKTGDCTGDVIGYQIAQCNASGDWIVIYDNCVLKVIKYLKDRSENLLAIDLPQFAQNVSSATATNAAEITKSPATILTIVELLKTIAHLSQTIIVNEDIMTDFLQTLDVIGSGDAQDAWWNINRNSTTMMKSSELLKSIESIARRLPDESFNIITNYTSFKKDINITNPFNGTFGKNSTTQINIPVISPKMSLTVIISSVLNNILPVRNLTYNDSSQTGTTINGDVAVIETKSTINNISLSFAIKNKALGKPQCVFWNFSLLNDIGGWDSTGCQLKTLGNQAERFTCECNHTTSFSILMSPVSTHSPALDIITYIGVGISMACLMLCLIIEIIIWKSVTRNDTSYMRHVSVVNIAVSLLIANICFIIGAAVVNQGEGPCSTATFFMHFFYLALFFWMLLSALLLLYRVLMVFSRMTRGTMMAIAFTVGYGAPLIIAVITVASTAGRKGYIQKDYNCWLNWNETKALLAFVIPALTIVAINLLVLIVVLCKMMRRGVNGSTQPDDKHPLLVIAKCVGILTPLFGLTWGFGIGTMVSPNFGVHVVFAFLNSLQGFFILVFGTLLDNKVREALAGKLALTNLSSNRTRSTSAGPSSLGAFPFIQRLRKRGAHNISEGRVLTTSSPF